MTDYSSPYRHPNDRRGMRPSFTRDEVFRVDEIDVTSVQDTFVRHVPNLWNTPPRLSPGRYRVTLEGEIKAEHPDLFYIDECGSLPPSTVRSLAASFEKLRGPAPTWRPGDVVVVQYAKGTEAPKYTYVRGATEWPTERGNNNMRDPRMDQLWDQGKVRPVLQAGGEPFDEDRLA